MTPLSLAQAHVRFLGDAGSHPALPAQLSEEKLKEYAHTYGEPALEEALLAETGVAIALCHKAGGGYDYGCVINEIVKKAGGPPVRDFYNEATAEGGPNWNGILRETSGIAGFALCTYLDVPPQLSTTVCVAAGKYAYDVAVTLAKAVYGAGKAAVEALEDLLGMGGGSGNTEPYKELWPPLPLMLSLTEAWYGEHDLGRATRIASVRTMLITTLASAESLAKLWKASTGTEMTVAEAYATLVRTGLRVPIGLWQWMGIPAPFKTVFDTRAAGPQGQQNGITLEWYVVQNLFRMAPSPYDGPGWYDQPSTMKGLIGQPMNFGLRDFRVANGWSSQGGSKGSAFVMFVYDSSRPPLVVPWLKEYGTWYGDPHPMGTPLVWSWLALDREGGQFITLSAGEGPGVAAPPAWWSGAQQTVGAQFDPAPTTTNAMFSLPPSTDKPLSPSQEHLYGFPHWASLLVAYPEDAHYIDTDPPTKFFVELIASTLGKAMNAAMQELRWVVRNKELKHDVPSPQTFAQVRPPPPPGIVAPPVPHETLPFWVPNDPSALAAMANLPNLPPPDPDALLAQPAHTGQGALTEDAPPPAGMSAPAKVLLGATGLAAVWSVVRLAQGKPLLPWGSRR